MLDPARPRGEPLDFSFSEEQNALRASVIEFANKELNRDLKKRDREARFSREAWEACARFGVQGMPMPKEYGGAAADIVTTALMMEGLGYGCRDNGLVFALNAQMWSIQMPILDFGSLEQKKKYLPGLIAGKVIGAHGMTEAGSGSDAFSMQTRAVRKGSKYSLNGSKLYISNAPVADLFLVFANVGEAKGFAGATAFLVDSGAPGLKVSDNMEKMGLRTSTIGEVVLDDVEVPETRRLGREGMGMALFNSSMEWERAGILACAVGAMQRQLEACVKYAKVRKQFGQPIGKFQSVSNKIADMYLRMEASRMLIYRVAWLKQQGKPAIAEAAAAKLYTSEAWVKNSLEAIQIHGAFGYMSDSEVERDLRDSLGGTIYSGTSEIQRLIIARDLGL